MDISVLLIRAVLFALPGILANRLYRTLQGTKEQKDWEDFIDIVVFSVLSYGLYGLFVETVASIGLGRGTITITQAIFDEKAPINWGEIFVAVIIGLVLSVFASYMVRFKTVNKVGRLIGASSRFGDDEVWKVYHRLYTKKWVFVRDHKLGLVYYGIITAYSEKGNVRELIISAVDVHENSDGEFLYRTDAIYLARELADLSIEVPPLPEVDINLAGRTIKTRNNSEEEHVASISEGTIYISDKSD